MERQWFEDGLPTLVAVVVGRVGGVIVGDVGPVGKFSMAGVAEAAADFVDEVADRALDARPNLHLHRRAVIEHGRQQRDHRPAVVELQLLHHLESFVQTMTGVAVERLAWSADFSIEVANPSNQLVPKHRFRSDGVVCVHDRSPPR